MTETSYPLSRYLISHVNKQHWSLLIILQCRVTTSPVASGGCFHQVLPVLCGLWWCIGTIYLDHHKLLQFELLSFFKMNETRGAGIIWKDLFSICRHPQPWRSLRENDSHPGRGRWSVNGAPTAVVLTCLFDEPDSHPKVVLLHSMWCREEVLRLLASCAGIRQALNDIHFQTHLRWLNPWAYLHYPW